MKKLAIGCAVVLVLFGIAAAGVTYYVYRQARTMVAQFAELSQVPNIERGLKLRGSYTPPVSEELTASQLERLLRVQTKIKQRLGTRFAELDQKYKTLTQKKEATIADMPALMAAYRDLAAAWVEAKRTQVDALNEAELSLEEYRWIREQAYRAVGMPYVDLDVGKIANAVKSGNVDFSPGGRTRNEPGTLRGSIGPSGPEANRKLVEPFKRQLEDNVPLASFGL
jgi:hypothetical protein